MRHSTDNQLKTLLASAGLLVLAGCASGGSPVVVNPSGGLASFPAAPAPAAQNTYRGTDSLYDWTLNVDDGAHTWSYLNSGTAAPTGGGTLTPVNGFQSLGTASDGTSLGLMLEAQGRLALLRPGNSSASLLVSVPQTSCYVLLYKLRFSYVAMATAPLDYASGAPFQVGATGSIVASTNADGSAWHYEALESEFASGPASFDGTCAVTGGPAALAFTNPSALNTIPTGQTVPVLTYSPSGPPISTALTIGPTGVFVARQSNSSAATPAASLGFAEVAVPIQASDIATGTYLGFLAQNNSTFGGAPYPGGVFAVSFAQDGTQKTVLTGGEFPNDDPTQANATDISISLGAPSPTINGIFPSVRITKPDPNQFCVPGFTNAPGVSAGVSASGYPTCTFPAVGVAGLSDNKHVIFLAGFDPTFGQYSTTPGTSNLIGTPIQIYLYQQ